MRGACIIASLVLAGCGSTLGTAAAVSSFVKPTVEASCFVAREIASACDRHCVSGEGDGCAGNGSSQ